MRTLGTEKTFQFDIGAPLPSVIPGNFVADALSGFWPSQLLSVHAGDSAASTDLTGRGKQCWLWVGLLCGQYLGITFFCISLLFVV